MFHAGYFSDRTERCRATFAYCFRVNPFCVPRVLLEAHPAIQPSRMSGYNLPRREALHGKVPTTLLET